MQEFFLPKFITHLPMFTERMLTISESVIKIVCKFLRRQALFGDIKFKQAALKAKKISRPVLLDVGILSRGVYPTDILPQTVQCMLVIHCSIFCIRKIENNLNTHQQRRQLTWTKSYNGTLCREVKKKLTYDIEKYLKCSTW